MLVHLLFDPMCCNTSAYEFALLHLAQGTVSTLRSFFFPNSMVHVVRVILLACFYCILFHDLAQAPMLFRSLWRNLPRQVLASECGFGCPPSFYFHPLLGAYYLSYTLSDCLVLLLTLLAIDSAQWPTTYTGLFVVLNSFSVHNIPLDRHTLFHHGTRQFV